MPAARLVRWVDNFAARHGAVVGSLGTAPVSGILGVVEVPVLRLHAGDAVAELTLPRAALSTPGMPVAAAAGPTPDSRTAPLGDLSAVTSCLAAVAAHLLLPGRLTALVLLRRGGYAVGVVDSGQSGGSGQLVASKVGSRYVQSRSAAGGWSQQRYARRRENQAQQLVGALLEAARQVLPPWADLGAVVVGGDRTLVGRAVGELAVPEELLEPRLLDVPDPRRDVLLTAATRATSSVVRVTETTSGAA
ncbi:MAG: acVLRF1 family peptidyl-tRNA hydrolase [Actinomycetes bacterium]